MALFNLPIWFSPLKVKLSESIISDLELVKTVDMSLSPMYSIIMNPTTIFGEYVISKFAEYYTTDIPFLKDTQTLLKTYIETGETTRGANEKEREKMKGIWSELKEETGFCEKYLYIDWEMGKFLNTHSSFLQVMSIYNITSPIISFCLPIIILIVPFFVINARGLDITTSEYISILKKIIENHAIGKLILDFDEVSLSQKAYILCSTALYMFSIYQNVLVCLRFYKNIIKINTTLHTMKTYLTESILRFDSYLSQTNKLTNYSEFNETVRKNCDSLTEYRLKLDNLGTLKFSWENIINIGDRMQIFYHIYESKECNQIMNYSFDMHGYLDTMLGLIQNIHNKRINPATLLNSTISNKSNKTIFKNAFYPALMKDEAQVKNTCDFTKSIVLSGPNASGKTTILKTSIINTILTQQFGYGCYEEATVIPFKFIHCYLNIPDTSGRDSLFQAEARRCKDIIDMIDANPDDKHFCAFDELYSGTNPEDAIASSLAFMQYISSNKNVSSILTTHYNKVCRRLVKNKRVENYNMKTVSNGDNTFIYTYKLEKGISNIKGGVKVLTELNYPSSIVENTRNMVSSFYK
jgi:hypothetical protein